MSEDLDLDKPCEHPDFLAEVLVTRRTETDDAPAVGFTASIRAWCSVCGETFRWMGLKAGDRPDRPMVSVDEAEMRAPLRPASSDPDFGMGLPGFAINMREVPE